MHFFQLASVVLLPLAGLVNAQFAIDLKPYQCVAHPRADPIGACGVHGHVGEGVHGWKTYHISQEQCATLCTCRDDQCHSFAWRPHHPGASYGPCTIFAGFLEQLHFRRGKSVRAFWDRTCYNRRKPTSTTTGVQQSPTSTYKAPKHTKRAIPAEAPKMQVKRSVVEVRNVQINESDEAPVNAVEARDANVAEPETLNAPLQARSVDDIDAEFQNGILDALS